MFDAAVWLDSSGGHAQGPKAIFGPDDIAVMRRALDLSWSALAFAHFETECDVRATRERLAKRILEDAARGERRPPVLSGQALGVLEPRSARRSPEGSQWRSSRFAS